MARDGSDCVGQSICPSQAQTLAPAAATAAAAAAAFIAWCTSMHTTLRNACRGSIIMHHAHVCKSGPRGTPPHASNSSDYPSLSCAHPPPSSSLFLVLCCFLRAEFAQGELFEILEDDQSLPEDVVQSIAKQLVRALHYLHSNRIIHRCVPAPLSSPDVRAPTAHACNG